jgi:DNA-binding NtrC family response regulator
MKTVLLIEPDADSATTYSESLRRAGFHVVTATDDEVRREPVPDVVVLSLARADRSMPHVFAHGRSVPRIVLSSEPSDAARASEFNCAGILIRPVMYDHLVTLVRRVLKEAAAVQAV